MRIRISFGSLKSILLAGIASGAMMAAATAAEAQTAGYTITTIDVAGGSSPEAYGISNGGEIVGGYLGRYESGFLDTSGVITTPAALLGMGYARGVNDTGQAVGTLPGCACRGYLYSNGNTSWIVDQNEAYSGSGTFATGINNNGNVVGYYMGGDYNFHGFIDKNGTFTDINDPKANSAYDSMAGTFAEGINNNGQIAGYYVDVSNQAHGFVDTNGTFSTIDVTGSSVGTTYVEGINDSGAVVGYSTVGRTQEGFLYANGSFTTVEVAGAALTEAYGINNAGDIVGYYIDASGGTHGFLATPDTGVAPLPVIGGTLPGGMLLLGWLGRRLALRQRA